VVHMPQFNGKQEGHTPGMGPNLRCPRNGKQTSGHERMRERSLSLHPTATGRHAVSSGKAMEVGLSARIPANKVVVRLATDAPP